MHKNAKMQMNFRVLRQSFCGKFKLSAESGRPRCPLLECMGILFKPVNNRTNEKQAGTGTGLVSGRSF